MSKVGTYLKYGTAAAIVVLAVGLPNKIFAQKLGNDTTGTAGAFNATNMSIASNASNLRKKLGMTEPAMGTVVVSTQANVNKTDVSEPEAKQEVPTGPAPLPTFESRVNAALAADVNLADSASVDAAMANIRELYNTKGISKEDKEKLAARFAELNDAAAKIEESKRPKPVEVAQAAPTQTQGQNVAPSEEKPAAVVVVPVPQKTEAEIVLETGTSAVVDSASLETTKEAVKRLFNSPEVADSLRAGLGELWKTLIDIENRSFAPPKEEEKPPVSDTTTSAQVQNVAAAVGALETAIAEKAESLKQMAALSTEDLAKQYYAADSALVFEADSAKIKEYNDRKAECAALLEARNVKIVPMDSLEQARIRAQANKIEEPLKPMEQQIAEADSASIITLKAEIRKAYNEANQNGNADEASRMMKLWETALIREQALSGKKNE